jgi:hypothetical protein
VVDRLDRSRSVNCHKGSHEPDARDMTTFVVNIITPKVWIERPELGTYTASISQIWSMIEYDLSIVFILLSGSNLALGAAFAAVLSIRTRVQMIGALVDRFLEDADRENYKSLGKRIERMGRRRNDIVHGIRSIRKGEPDVVFLQKPYPRTLSEAEPVAYRKAEFKRVILELESLRSDIKNFRMHLSELAKAKPFPRSFLLPPE